jgi:DNA polymerase II large subunit
MLYSGVSHSLFEGVRRFYMQRDDRKKWSGWQLLFPLLLSIFLLILRSRLKVPAVERISEGVGGEATDVSERGVDEEVEREEVEGNGNDEVEVKPTEVLDVDLSESVVEVGEDSEDGGGEEEIAENEGGIENEEGVEVEAYCVKCRQKRSMEGPREIETKNGRHALEGTCPVCGTRLFRFIAG